jgi:hypothetical protein
MHYACHAGATQTYLTHHGFVDSSVQITQAGMLQVLELPMGMARPSLTAKSICSAATFPINQRLYHANHRATEQQHNLYS